MNNTQHPCPCGNSQTYAQCCQPLHQGQQVAGDARQLMKSRYCAYHQLAVDYLVATTASDTRAEHQPDAIRQWAEACEWLKLEVLDYQPGDDVSWVEFAAWYRQDGKLAVHHERSQFVKTDGHWYFHHGEYPARGIALPKRNDPCFCGSGNKFKRCCGR